MGLTRLFGGATGITNQPQGLDIGLGGSNIKTVQRGIFSFTNASNTQTVTVSSVNTINCLLKLTNVPIGGPSGIQELAITGVLTNSTTITLSCGGAAVSQDVSWELIEFNNVKSRQTGEVTNTSPQDTPSNITITSVNTSKTISYVTYKSTSGATGFTATAMYYGLTSSTNLRIKQGANINAAIYSYQVIEFN